MKSEYYELRETTNKCGDEWMELYQGEKYVSSDGGEPEDNTFYRDWAWVPERLNAHVDEENRLREERDKWKAVAEAHRAMGGTPVRMVLDENKELRAALEAVCPVLSQELQDKIGRILEIR